MALFSLICAILFSFYLFIGLYVLSRDKSSPVHRIFFFNIVCLALWALSGIFLFSTNDPETAKFCVTFGSIGIILFIPGALQFSIAVTRVFRLRYAYILYIPFLAIVAHNLNTPIMFSNIHMVDGYWLFVPDFGSPWHRVYSFLVFLFLGTSIFLLFRWYARSEGKREKRQALAIALSLAISFILIVIEEIVLPVFILNFTPGLGPLTFLIFVGGVTWAILRYRFLDLSASLVSDDILANIDESIILLTENFHIAVINKKAEEILGIAPGSTKGRFFLQFILEKEALASALREIIAGKTDFRVVRFHFITPSRPLLMQANLSPAKDSSGDRIGVLIIAKESMKELFMSHYDISRREFEIIMKMLEGLTNREIAEELAISEITVKSHVSHIYDKLDVRNRVKLLDTLKAYRLA
ncbi:MAG TPA: histidine kinase N-terminal 7TM domain-containing protein [Spirochaetota bacterium]|nr:histidine kinase N-terminal 7TM domain-containing protein [Spirochaetota bacterium]HPI90827.1 histidine kinase N-terminal 7TM domain-containing protein [Spirochaetota bacterium]HPR47622.1 histidine kinase N-terminal 7TM domain-containing protein [Spirochaetota bacterium]